MAGVGGRSLWMTFLVCDEIFKRLGRMASSRYSIVSTKKRQFLSLSVTSALLGSVSTLQTCTIWPSWHFNNTVASLL